MEKLPNDVLLREVAINEADPIGHLAKEAICVHMCLDDAKITREKNGLVLSLWGRILQFAIEIDRTKLNKE